MTCHSHEITAIAPTIQSIPDRQNQVLPLENENLSELKYTSQGRKQLDFSKKCARFLVSTVPQLNDSPCQAKREGF